MNLQALVKENMSFNEMLEMHHITLKRKKLSVLQVNMGRKCNQACVHCHVDAGPDRTEAISNSAINRVLELLSRNSSIHTVDITGGAPELNPDFRYFIDELCHMGKRVIDRCNLTVLLEDGLEDLPEFLAGHGVAVIASLPCYIRKNVDLQRGDDVYIKSISALRRLNNLGYGMKNSGLELNLVFNPTDASLPPAQKNLERDYKLYLKNKYGIEFNRLLTITNMPIKRFAKELVSEGRYHSYCTLLAENFNPDAARNIMCRSLLSVGWDGKISDCDFNQALGIPLKKKSKTIWNISDFSEIGTEISFDSHCFGCTAGCGSSCGGALL